MKKRITILALILALGLTGIFSGCSSASDDKTNEYKEQGISQMESGDYADAETSFQNALDQSNGIVGDAQIDLCYYKALAQFKAGEVEDAIATYSGLIDYDDTNWKAYYLRGCVYASEGQANQAIADFDQAVSLNDSDFELYGNIYQTLADAGYEDQGLTYLDQALEAKDNKANAYGLGYIYFLCGDYDNAVTYLKKSCDAGEDKAYLLLGEVYMSQGSTDAAKEAFNSYLEKYPDNMQAIANLGDTALEAEDYEDAIAYYKKVKDGGDSDVLQNCCKNLVVAYEKTQQYEEAYQASCDYLAAFPEDKEMQKESEFLATRVEDNTDSEAEDTTDSE